MPKVKRQKAEVRVRRQKTGVKVWKLEIGNLKLGPLPTTNFQLPIADWLLPTADYLPSVLPVDLLWAVVIGWIRSEFFVYFTAKTLT